LENKDYVGEMDFLAISFSLAAALLTVLGVIVYRMVVSGGDLPIDTEWIEELSVERYRPMIRLLNSADIDFLRSQPGFTPQMEAALRKERRQVFSGYLRLLETDFRRVSMALKVLMLQSRYDRPDLASTLLRQQAVFALGMTMVRIRVALFQVGLGAVDASMLVKAFDSMRLELRSLTPVMAAA
jgi:hypothetical protein